MHITYTILLKKQMNNIYFQPNYDRIKKNLGSYFPKITLASFLKKFEIILKLSLKLNSKFLIFI